MVLRFIVKLEQKPTKVLCNTASQDIKDAIISFYVDKYYVTKDNLEIELRLDKEHKCNKHCSHRSNSDHSIDGDYDRCLFITLPNVPYDTTFYAFLKDQDYDWTKDCVIADNTSKKYRKSNQVSMRPLSESYKYYLFELIQSLLSNETNVPSMSLVYTTIFAHLLKTYVDDGFVIDKASTQVIMSTMACYCYDEFQFDTAQKYVESLFGSDDAHVKYFKPDPKIKSFVRTESILRCLDYEGNKFHICKGLFMATYIKMLPIFDASLSTIHVADFIAHLLRLTHGTTQLNPSAMTPSYRFHSFHSAWIVEESDTSLTTAILTFKKRCEQYVTSEIIEAVGMTTADYTSIINSFKNPSGRETYAHIKKRMLINNFYKEENVYNRNIRFNNMTYELDNDLLRIPAPHDISCNGTGYDFLCPEDDVDPKLEAKLDEMMEDYFPDPKVRNYIYDVFASCLKGNNDDKSFWMFVGPGNTGKSKFMELIRETFGSYYVVLSASTFAKRSRSSDQASPALMSTKGKLIGVIQEPTNDGSFDTTSIKERTGETKITGRDLFKGFETIDTTIRYFLCANELRLNTTDNALWNRCKVVMFSRRFVTKKEYNRLVKESSEDKVRESYRIMNNSIDKLFPKLAPILMRRLLERYQVMKDTNIKTPKTVRAWIEEFRLNNDSLANFIASNFKRSKKSDNAKPLSVHDAYQRFCEWHRTEYSDNKSVQLKRTQFVEAIKNSNIALKDGDKYIQGYYLKPYRVINVDPVKTFIPGN